MIHNKNKNKVKNILQYALCFAFILLSSCKDEDKDPLFVQLDENNYAPYVRLVPSTSIFDISQIDNTSYVGTLSAPEDNVSSWSVSVYRVSGGVQSETVFVKTYTSFPADLDISTTEIASALGITTSDFVAGDNIQFVGTSTGDNGTTITFDDLSGNITGQGAQFQSYEFGVFVGCPETDEAIDVVSGDWTINMFDAYGDGWQPTTADGGGPGIIVTLSDGTTYEIGLCTPYEDPGYNCTEGLASGTRIINIPSGITDQDWEWTFTGDNWGEMSYEIFSPNGNLVGVGATGMSAGTIDLFMCAQ